MTVVTNVIPVIILATTRNSRHKAVESGSEIGLSRACTAKGLLIKFAQHGLSKEVCRRHTRRSAVLRLGDNF
ncbi:MAG: hypothetical protein HFE35_07175 [Clostridia bacterium]|nr:hypothetical protein [Clostridia bacterium]